jgi:hypothetical protein
MKRGRVAAWKHDNPANKVDSSVDLFSPDQLTAGASSAVPSTNDHPSAYPLADDQSKVDSSLADPSTADTSPSDFTLDDLPSAELLLADLSPPVTNAGLETNAVLSGGRHVRALSSVSDTKTDELLGTDDQPTPSISCSQLSPIPDGPPSPLHAVHPSLLPPRSPTTFSRHEDLKCPEASPEALAAATEPSFCCHLCGKSFGQRASGLVTHYTLQHFRCVR